MTGRFSLSEREAHIQAIRKRQKRTRIMTALCGTILAIIGLGFTVGIWCIGMVATVNWAFGWGY